MAGYWRKAADGSSVACNRQSTYNYGMPESTLMSQPDSGRDPVPTALVAEDEKFIAQLLRFILEREGFRVEHAADGREAERLIATLAAPTVVLLDIMLPYTDGFDLIAAIRAQPGWQTLPILMLSSKGSERDIARALDAGADDYIVKPFQPDELKARLRRMLRGRS